MNLPPSIYIARSAKRIPPTFEMGTKYEPHPIPMRVDLVDPQILLEHLMETHESLELECIKLNAMVYGVTDYFSLRALADTRTWRVGQDPEGDLKINGVRILLDPMREGGAPLPLFEESEAIKIMSMRRKK